MTIQEKVAFVKIVFPKAEIVCFANGYSVWRKMTQLTPVCRSAREAWEKAYEVASLER